MTPRLIVEWGPIELPPPSMTEDTYAHYGCTWEGDTAEETLEATRNWCWEKIGTHGGSYIRSAPYVESAHNFETQKATFRGHARLSVLIPQDVPVSFGTLQAKA